MDIDTGNLIYIILEVVIAFLAVFGNILVCYIVLKSNRLRKKPMYMILVSLAFADITVGFLAIPFSILTKLGLPHNVPYLCIVMLTFIVVATQISIFNLTIASIERYLAICHPREHFNKLTSKRTFYIIVLTWIVSIYLGVPPLGWNNLQEAIANHESISYENSGAENVTAASFQCLFIEVMNYDFMFFNFIACVIPPLLVCAASYLLIFRSVMKTSAPPSSPAINQSKRFSSLPSVQKSSSLTIRKTKAEVPQHSYTLQDRIQVVQTVCDHQGTAGETFQAASNQDSADPSSQFQFKFSWLTSLMRMREHKSSDNTNRGFRERGVSTLSSVVLEDMASEFTSELSKASKDEARSNFTLRRQQGRVKRLKKKRETQAAVVLGVLVLMFAVCLIPIHILNTIYRFSTPGSVFIPSWIFSVAILSSHANSAVNVFLYSWRLKAFRKEMNRRVLCKFT